MTKQENLYNKIVNKHFATPGALCKMGNQFSISISLLRSWVRKKVKNRINNKKTKSFEIRYITEQTRGKVPEGRNVYR
jgi:hypothetical protein